jgi:hypothetical protein
VSETRTPPMNDDGYLLLAIADDFLTEHRDEVVLDPDDVYDWLVAQAHKIGGAA